MKTVHYPNLSWRDAVWRINFEDGRGPEYFTVYNNELISWTDGCPEEIKHYGRYFNAALQYELSSRGMMFTFEGINE